ncbi:MAG: cobaltochelatase subunit CobN [Prevotella sp.]|nr:cobaltochelatase subunit CobN [Prevotella sp.]
MTKISTVKRTILYGACAAMLAGFLGYFGYRHWMAPTRILIVNTLRAQEADFILSNDSRHIEVECVEGDQMGSLNGYDAVVIYARRIYLNDEQLAEIERVSKKGVPVFTKALKSTNFVINKNLSKEQIDQLQQYFENENRENYRNGLRYLRHIATPHRWGDQEVEAPVEILKNMYYHRAYGRYFKNAAELTAYLKKEGMYHEGGNTVALISGIQFPMEGNREHVDTLITMLTRRGMNVYPMTCTGKKREKMIKELMPDAIVYMSMGRLGNDTLISWLQEKNILLFNPFPLSATHEEWMDANRPMTAGSKNSRIVIPEIDGGITPFCIGTQNKDKKGFYKHTAEVERCTAFAETVEKYLALRTKNNADKRIAIGYFKRPGKDALLASGMEVIPSMYNFLKQLRAEGYNVSGLPTTLGAFARQIKTEGMVMGSYAKGVQEKYMREGHPLWLTKEQYERWAKEVLAPQKYGEVVEHYGEAPGSLLSKGDSLAVACIRYGNILLFPQPRPALGDDDFKLVHGVEVPPPHSYLAPYLYMQKGFQADALIHFGTHGNLEFTPGRDAGMRHEDWSAALIGSIPHFYYYTTGNVGESIIAKRRSHAVLLTYLTAPYVPSGMQEKYATLLNNIHKAVESGGQNVPLILSIKKEITKQGLHRELNLDDNLSKPYTTEELERLDAHLEELSNEKMQGAYYTMGQPYSGRDLQNTTIAICADPLAYDMARKDRDAGRITTKQLQDYAFVAHHYLPRARRAILNGEDPNAKNYASLLLQSTHDEFSNMVRALNGGTVAPAPGGDPVLNPNVLPTGRNMFSINPENTPDPQAWEDGKRLAENTLERYRKQHNGEWPRKVSYTFWAGEFINTQGATIAQALWMLGVEPIRDKEGRINDFRLIPRKELRRPRINVVVQVSGQLRDIAGSRLKLITDAVKLASTEKEDSNFVYEGTLLQEKQLMEKGVSPKQARELSTMRVFGPVNNGYSTGMMNYIERSGTWDKPSELADGYLNNMGASYGDEQHWGGYQPNLFASALQETDVVVQPRQSNTWGPVSLDHVYEFTGGLSLTVKTLTGKQPDAYLADYRNRSNRRMQDAKEAIAVEVRTSLLNPVYIKEHMKGDEGTAQMFGEMFRNIFGWSATRPDALDKELYNDLFRLYVTDEQQLGVRKYFQKVNPAAYQAMTSVMLESARKGFWKPTAAQLKSLAQLHAEITNESGAACTDFVCNNEKLQSYISSQLQGKARSDYQRSMDAAKLGQSGQKEMVLKEKNSKPSLMNQPHVVNGMLVGGAVVAVLLILIAYLRRRK